MRAQSYVSNFLEFTYPGYRLSAIPNGSIVTFNWTPDANSTVRVEVGDMTKNSATQCNEAAFRPEFPANQTSPSSAETGPRLELIAGHKYCAVMRANSFVSNFLEFTMP